MFKPVTASFSDQELPQSGLLILPVYDDLKMSAYSGPIDASAAAHLKQAAELQVFQGKFKTSLATYLTTQEGDLLPVLLIGLGDRSAIDDKQEKDWVNLGGFIRSKVLNQKETSANLLVDGIGQDGATDAKIAADIALGFGLKDYKFDKYKENKSPKKNESKPLKKLIIHTPDIKVGRKEYKIHSAVMSGMYMARDLVNEPANVLYPESFAKRVSEMKKAGLDIQILDEKAMKKLNMNALLGVGQGSARPPRLVVMKWKGSKASEKPVAFIGKGVTFDTGGISIKPSAGMGDMKGDMGGAACVTGLMLTLATRKAKVNAIGVIGLAENMPGRDAQRPGDIVTSMSGKTIEVLNTDAEGRLVLADALWYTQEKFKPKIMINLATLTGAILVALGQEYAGLFSNSDELSAQLNECGLETDEKVWRMPMGPAFDKMINSKNADMKNIGGRFAGSTTAAQFLQRYVNDVDWAHIDIAGTAMNSPASDINQSWGSGYGVRLLDRLVAKHYES